MYVPKSIAEGVQRSDESKDHSVLVEYSNKVFVIEKNGQNHFPESGSLLHYVLPKKTLLDDNIILLMKLKEEYLPHSFKYIYQKYSEQLFYYKRIAKWLLDHLNEHMSKTDEYNQDAFAMQYRLFSEHELELKQLFKDETIHNREEVKTETPSKSAIEEKTLPLSSEKLKTLIFPTQTNVSDKNDKRSKIAELKSFTEEYAESLILKNIFNVRLEQIENKA